MVLDVNCLYFAQPKPHVDWTTFLQNLSTKCMVQGTMDLGTNNVLESGVTRLTILGTHPQFLVIYHYYSPTLVLFIGTLENALIGLGS